MPVMNLRLKMQRFNVSRPILGGAATNVKEHVVPETEEYTLETEQDVNTIVKQIVDTVGVDPIIEFVNGYLNAGLIKSEDRDLLYATVKQLQESCNTYRVEAQSSLDELRTYLLSCNKNSFGCTVLGAIRMLIKLHSEDKGKWMADLKAGLELRDKVTALEKNVVEVESLQRKTPAVQDEISALKTRITELQDLNKHLMEQRDKYQATIDEHVRTIAAQKMHLDQLEKDLEAKKNEVFSLSSEILGERTKVNDLNNVISSKNVFIIKEQEKVSKLTNALYSKEKELKKLESYVEKLRDDVKEIEKSRNMKLDLNMKLREEIDRLNLALEKQKTGFPAYEKGKISNAIGNIHLALDVLKELTAK